jgi:DNA-binding transcriptional regulator YhcF (GntR family)
MALLVLDPSSSTPPYEQVRAQIAAAIEDGTLGPATQLPTVRRLARDLNLAVNTVARAYRELELAGLVETRGRQGTLVAGPMSQTRDLAAQAARAFLQRMSDLGIDPARAIAIVRHEAEIAAAKPARVTPEPAVAPRLAPRS